MNKTGQNDGLFYLIRGINILLKVHRNNLCLCANSKEWNDRYYGWHTPYFPPEYQRCCLNGRDFTPNMSCDLYMFFIKYYIWVTGSHLNVNFQRNKSWIEVFLISTEEWVSEIQDAVIDLISLCINRDPDRRMQSASELVKEKSFLLLEEQAGRCDFEEETFEIRSIDTADKWRWKDVFLFD